MQASIFCDEIASDPQGRLILSGAFHSLPRGEFPEFFLVNYWRLDDVREQRYYECLELRDPDGAILGDLTTKRFPLGGKVRRHFNLIRFYQVKLVTAGPHEVRVILRDSAAEAVVATASVPLQVD